MYQIIFKSTLDNTLEQRIDTIDHGLGGHLAGNNSDADRELIQLFSNRVQAVRVILQSSTDAKDESRSGYELLVAEIEEDTKALYDVLPFPPEYLITW